MVLLYFYNGFALGEVTVVWVLEVFCFVGLLIVLLIVVFLDCGWVIVLKSLDWLLNVNISSLAFGFRVVVMF